MIIVMKPEATANDLEAVKNKIKNEGLDYHLSQGSSRTIVGVIGDKKKIAMLQMNSFSGVEKTVSITEKYKLVSREFKKEDSVVDVDGVKIGGGHFAVMAGPCGTVFGGKPRTAFRSGACRQRMRCSVSARRCF